MDILKRVSEADPETVIQELLALEDLDFVVQLRIARARVTTNILVKEALLACARNVQVMERVRATPIKEILSSYCFCPVCFCSAKCTDGTPPVGWERGSHEKYAPLLCPKCIEAKK